MAGRGTRLFGRYTAHDACDRPATEAASWSPKNKPILAWCREHRDLLAEVRGRRGKTYNELRQHAQRGGRHGGEAAHRRAAERAQDPNRPKKGDRLPCRTPDCSGTFVWRVGASGRCRACAAAGPREREAASG
jgi:hypothetical protein